MKNIRAKEAAEASMVLFAYIILMATFLLLNVSNALSLVLSLTLPILGYVVYKLGWFKKLDAFLGLGFSRMWRTKKVQLPKQVLVVEEKGFVTPRTIPAELVALYDKTFDGKVVPEQTFNEFIIQNVPNWLKYYTGIREEENRLFEINSVELTEHHLSSNISQEKRPKLVKETKIIATKKD